MPNPAVKPSIADGTTKGIRGRVGHRQNILKKGVSGFPEAPFFAKLPKGHRREVRQEHVAGSGGEAVVGAVKRSSNVVKQLSNGRWGGRSPLLRRLRVPPSGIQRLRIWSITAFLC